MADDADVTEVENLETAEAEQPAETESTDVQETTDAESQETSTEETESQEESTEESETEDGEAAAESEETQTDDKEAARQAYKQRQAAKQERDYIQGLRERTQEYERNMDKDDVAERMRVLEAREYIRSVEQARESLVNQDARAKAELPIFNPKSEDFNQVAYEAAMQKFANSYVVEDEETGDVIGAFDPRTGRPVDLYQYLKSEADVFNKIGQTYARKGQQAASKMQHRAVTPPASAPRAGSGESLEDLEARIGNIPLN